LNIYGGSTTFCHVLSTFFHRFWWVNGGTPLKTSQEMGFPASAVRRSASAAEAAEDAVSGGGVRVYLLPGGIGQVQRYSLVNIQKTMENHNF